MRNLIKLLTVVLLLALTITVFSDGMPVETAQDSFFKAVKRGDVTGAKSYLDTNQVTINAKDIDGNTALMIAVDNVDIKMVIALIAYKPDPKATNNAGKTVMDIAATKGNAQLTATLKNAGF